MRFPRVLLLFLLLSGTVCAQGQITVYLAGDSTMAQQLPEKRPETGWGEVSPNYPKGIEDNTHFSPLGADAMACLVVAAIRELHLPLAKYLERDAASSKGTPVSWRINRADKIGGHKTETLGNPQLVDTPDGQAVLFDGVDDGLIVKTNPLAGASAFTVEAVFRPDAGGTFEQRWFHIQEEAHDNRVLLEIRLTGDEWFLDTFIKSGENKRTLYSENFKHKAGEWYHVALTFDGVNMRHFVDGREELSGPLTIQPLGAGSTSIGVRMNRVFWFKGAVRKARFTPRALSPKEFMGKK